MVITIIIICNHLFSSKNNYLLPFRAGKVCTALYSMHIFLPFLKPFPSFSLLHFLYVYYKYAFFIIIWSWVEPSPFIFLHTIIYSLEPEHEYLLIYIYTIISCTFALSNYYSIALEAEQTNSMWFHLLDRN